MLRRYGPFGGTDLPQLSRASDGLGKIHPLHPSATRIMAMPRCDRYDPFPSLRQPFRSRQPTAVEAVRDAIDASPDAGPGQPHREMDASRCIAYLTIEKNAPLWKNCARPRGGKVFGCEYAADVCPGRNRRAPVSVSGRHGRRRSGTGQSLVNSHGWPVSRWQTSKRSFKARP